MASPEYHLTTATAAFLRLVLPEGYPWTHFPAGERRDSRTGAKLKHMGLNPGWADFLLILPMGKLGCIELKAPKGRLSDEQKAFRDDALELGAWWAECRSLAEVEATLIGWLSPFNVKLRARAAA
jgi:hypothetical protein